MQNGGREAELELEVTNRVRRTVAETARLPASMTVESVVAAVMCALTERLTAGEAYDLLHGVPKPVARMFEPCVIHREGRPTIRVDRAELVDAVAEHLAVTPAHAELICSAVFTAIRAELPAEIVIAVGGQLPHGLKELWLAAPMIAPDLDVDLAPEETRLAMERDLDRRAGLPPHVTPSAAFAAVMCAFARRLSGGETRHLFLGLPAVVRPLIERCTAHRAEEAAVFGSAELLRQVADHLVTEGEVTERIVLEVLRAVKRNLPLHTIDEIASQLPADLLELWQAALPAHDDEGA
jgi:uncharacterized protein (DUF2267 family)